MMELWQLRTEDILYEEDVDARIQEIEDALEGDYPQDPEYADERSEAERELSILKMFRDEVDDFDGGLINEDYFEDYARELAEDIGAISDDASWPATCIDWEAAAEDLKMDYTAYGLDGATFYGRS